MPVFLIPLKINRTSYNFKRYSKIEVREPRIRAGAGGRYRIINRIGFNTDVIFINGFFYKDDARDIINHIKSSEDDIQIEKYWIGYKIR